MNKKVEKVSNKTEDKKVEKIVSTFKKKKKLKILPLVLLMYIQLLTTLLFQLQTKVEM